MRSKAHLAILLILTYNCCVGQDYKAIYQFTLENDLLFHDKYYTNGIKIVGMNPKLKQPFLPIYKVMNVPNRLIVKDESRLVDYGITLSQLIYTPSYIYNDSMAYRDRPFAGWLYLGFRNNITDTLRGIRFSSELNLGIIGPLSFAKEAQTITHIIIDRPKPKGWEGQIKTNIGINYTAKSEVGLISIPAKKNSIKRLFEIIPNAEASLGTVFNFIGTGGSIRLGKINSYFKSRNPIGTVISPTILNSNTLSNKKKSTKNNQQNKLQFYLFLNPQVRFILYNAMLQGGIFDNSSPVRVSTNEVNRVYFNSEIGATIACPRFILSVSRSYRTSEFKYSNPNNHKWASITIAYVL